MTEKNKNGSNTYAELSIREQLYLEARAMAEYALANGKMVPPVTIKTIESYTTAVCVTGSENNLKELLADNKQIEGLVDSHNVLVKIVAPAKPNTLLLLDMEQKETGFWKFLGAVSLVRQMIIVAIICLLLFMLTSLSGYVKQDVAGMMGGAGLPLLMNLLFYLSAAGLGASFAGLYKANSYITEGTFDITYQSSYWIRFLLGLIAGLLTAVIISEKAVSAALQSNNLFEPGIIKPLLAMLGGFSADMVYTILSRLVETVESLFRGSSKNIISAKIQETNTRMETSQAHQNLKIASKIMAANSAIHESTDPKQIKQLLAHLIETIVPAAGIDPKS